MHTFDREIWGAMFPTLLRGGGETSKSRNVETSRRRNYKLIPERSPSHFCNLYGVWHLHLERTFRHLLLVPLRSTAWWILPNQRGRVE